MTDKQRQLAIQVLIAIVVMVFGLAGYDVIVTPSPPSIVKGAQKMWQPLLLMSNLDVRGNISDGGSSAALTLDDDVTVTGAPILTWTTVVTVTDGTAFTPTAGLQPIQNLAAEVTPTLGVGSTAGQLLILLNTSTNTINLADAGHANLSAAWAAGQYDNLWLVWNDDEGKWDELSRSNN